MHQLDPHHPCHPAEAPDSSGADDRGAVLPLVLVFMVLAVLLMIPLLSFAVSVFRAGTIEEEKAEALEMARGGTWVALHHQDDLYDLCVGGSLPSSLPDVATTCEVLRIEQLRPIEKVPFHVATVRAGAQVPATVATADVYTNPNTAAVPDQWLLAGDATVEAEAGKVWLPQLPVPATSSGGTRDTTMPPGTQDPNYSSCRVLFPGTFTTPMTFDGPTYLTSGVYSFTDQITLEAGADVVVGDGASIGCTTDFEAVANAVTVPDPLNMSGLGGTIVLGGDARIVVDDTTGSDPIRFVVNRRYVSADETSVQASRDVSIISVNGAHEPLLTDESYGDPLIVPDTINVPASTVGTEENPLAISAGYAASTVSFRPDPPDAPSGVDAEDAQDAYVAGSWDGVSDGRVVVEWDEPANNGSLITSYVASDQFGNSCSPAGPTTPGDAIQTTCTITGYAHGVEPVITVVATNGAGSSVPSSPFPAPRVDLSGTGQSPAFDRPSAPRDLTISAVYADGIQLTWAPPSSSGSMDVTGYQATVVDDTLTTLGTCTARFDATSCIVDLSIPVGVPLVVNVEAVHDEGDPVVRVPGAPATVLTTLDAIGTDTRPVPPPAPIPPVTPILDFTSETSSGVDVEVAGYVAVPQGLVALGAVDPSTTRIVLSGGLLAGAIDDAGGGNVPGQLHVEFDNPDAQKQIRLRSTFTGNSVDMTSEAIVQINRSGSIGINSWIIGATPTITDSAAIGDPTPSTTVVPTTIPAPTTVPPTTAPPTTAPPTTAPPTTAPPTTAPPTTAPPTTVAPAQLRQDISAAVVAGDFTSDGRGVGVPNRSGNNFNGAGATSSSVTFTFTVTEAGNYRMRASVKANRGSSDSFWVTGPGSPSDGWLWDTGRNPGYVIRSVGHRYGDRPQLVWLEPGTHQISLHLREDGTYVEWMELVRQ